MKNWTDWEDIENAKSSEGPFNCFGIYQIRAVKTPNRPIPINRLVGIDESGILYIGRSGYRHQNSKRTIANRIREFVQRQHSGGKTYKMAKSTLNKSEVFSGHTLEVRAQFLPDSEIDKAESEALQEYFSTYAELPPCNSAFPRAGKER